MIDTIKTAIPFQSAFRRLKRRLFSYGTDIDNDSGLFEDSVRMVTMLRNGGVSVENTTVLEFGSGWLPVLPLVFRLAGAQQVTLTDQERLLDKALLLQALDYIDQKRDELARIGLNSATTHSQLTQMKHEVDRAANIEQALAWLGLKYLVPFDPRSAQTGSTDIVVSRAVLEHVPEQLLRFFLAEFRRILKPDGSMCHVIDMSDHWEHADKSISRVNFLRYPDWLFRMTCLNPQNYQNRLRHSDFMRLFHESGFQIVENIGLIHEPALEALKTLPLNRRFRGLHPNDLATICAHMMVRAAGPSQDRVIAPASNPVPARTAR